MRGASDHRARYELAHLGEALGDPSRAAIVLALMGGEARPASELAARVGIARSTATSHLQRLERAGVLTARAAGRHRYYALASPAIAHAVEGLVGALSIPPSRTSREADPLRHARTCYRHLAGQVAVGLWARARDAGWVTWTSAAATLLPRGRDALAGAGLALDAATLPSGSLCLDWTERLPHVSGALGVVVCDALLAARWVARRPESRALRVTARGERSLRALGVDASA